MRIRILALAAFLALGLGAATVPVAPDKSPATLTEAQIQIADLKAQQSMALSAHSMLVPTYLQLLLGLAGTLGLFATIYYTRKSLDLARESLLVTRTEVANQNAATQRQLRAYVGVKLIKLRGLNSDNIGRATINVVNKGATPAKGIEVLSFWHFGPSRDLPEDFTGKSGPHTLGANDETEVHIPFDRSFTDDEKAALALPHDVPSDKLRFLVVGVRVTYMDVFGTEQVTKMAWSIRANANGSMISEYCSST